MKKIMFVCLGNICRSTMAEAVFRKEIENLNLQDKYFVSSGGTCAEQNYGVHRGTVKKLESVGIDAKKYVLGSKGYQIQKEDYDKYDTFYCMDDANVRDLLKIFGSDFNNKVKKLLDEDVKDPWYTRNFEKTYEDVLKGIKKILK